MTTLNKVVLQSVITDLENRRAFKSLTALFTEVAKSSHARKNHADVDACLQAAMQFGCKVKTNGGVLEIPQATERPAEGGRGRAKIEINKEELQAAVNLVEKDQTFDTLSELWEAVANTDWAKNFKPNPLSASVIILRVKEFGITYKTEAGKRGTREKLEVNKDEFQQIVDDLESKQTFEKLSDLWQAVAETDWAKKMQPRPLSAQVAYQRAGEFGIVCKTQPKRKPKGSTVADPVEEGEDILGEVVQSVRMAPDRTDLLNAGVFRHRNLRQVSVPAGTCPIPLKGTDDVTVATWARGVVQHFIKEGAQMLPTALIYFVRHSYDILGPEYKEVERLILDMKADLYEVD